MFKRHAIESSLRGDRTVNAVAEGFGIAPDRLYKWRQLYAPKPSGLEQAQPNRTLEQVKRQPPAAHAAGGVVEED